MEDFMAEKETPEVRISAKEFISYTEEHDLLMYLTEKQAQTVLNSYFETGYGLEIEGDSLRQIIWTETGIRKDNLTVDQVVDIAAEANYEKMLDAREDLRKAFNQKSMIEAFAAYVQCMKNDKHLRVAFSQTVYARNIDEKEKRNTIKNQEPADREKEKQQQNLPLRKKVKTR